MKPKREVPSEGGFEYNMLGISMGRRKGDNFGKPDITTKPARSYAEKVPSRDLQKPPLESLESLESSETQTKKERLEDLRGRILKTKRNSSNSSSPSK